MILGQTILSWRNERKLGVRAAAKLIGISSATLCRLENGNSCDSDVLVKVLFWLFSAGEPKEPKS